LATNDEGDRPGHAPADKRAAGDDRARRLLAVGRALVSELDPETVLDRILSEARELTGARFAALGVLDESRQALKRFVTSGLDEPVKSAIGDLPRGRGVLGVLIAEPRALRLDDVSEHPESYGFPPGHPPMSSFLGVPVMIRGHAWGNLYLTEKEGGGQFTAEDEEAALALAQWAAIAVANSQIHETSERRRRELERSVRSLEATRDIIYAIGGASELDEVLELIVKRGRALVRARTLLIMLREGDELVVAAAAGHAAAARGVRVPIAGSTSGTVLETGHARRVTDAATELRIDPRRFGVPDAHGALLVPMLSRGAEIGVLAAFDRGPEGGPFTSEDELLLQSFGQAAANTVRMKRSVDAEHMRAAIAAADGERARWARELHDETLQALGGLRVLLASTLGRADVEGRDELLRQAIEDIEIEIANLREIISDLRPSLLDDLGLEPAIEALLDRRRDGALRIESTLMLAAPGEDAGLTRDLETTVYRLVQEALTNIVKHANASSARVLLRRDAGEVLVEVADDGVGFDVDARSDGFGLSGMRERVSLAGGTLSLESGPRGTLVRARLPTRAPVEHPAASAAEAESLVG
jgi:signal transduction histidine kinase